MYGHRLQLLLGQKKMFKASVSYLEEENALLRKTSENQPADAAGTCTNCNASEHVGADKSNQNMKKELAAMRTSQTSLRSSVEVQNALIESFLRHFSNGDEEAMKTISAEAFEAVKLSTDRVQSQLEHERAQDELLNKIQQLESQVELVLVRFLRESKTK